MNWEGPPQKKPDRDDDSGQATSSRNGNGNCQRIRDFTRDHKRLLTARLHAGLLTPFKCALCHRVAFDPVGYHGKHRWSCTDCETVTDALERSRGR